MKQELIDRFKELLALDFQPDTDREMKEMGKTFNEIRRKLRDEELKVFQDNPDNVDMEFVPSEDPLDAEFDALYKQYRETKVRKQEERAAEERENLKQKKSIISTLVGITENEEHIGKAFDALKELREKWNAIGRVPGDVHKEINDEYQAAVDKFYYDIRIYRELQELDLKKNLEAKKGVLEQIKALDLDGDLKEVDVQVKELQKTFFEIGPVSRELYEGLKAEFDTACDLVYAKLKEHFEKLKSERTENLEKKKALLTQIQGISYSDYPTIKQWNNGTDLVKGIQEEWKKIGPGPRKENEEIWAELREWCDTFFEKKRAFFEKERGNQDKNKEAKDRLLEKAEALKTSTDWKETTQKMVKLQADWKKIGPARQRDEQGLWTAFRNACNHFFDAKKAYFDQLDESLKGNLEKKNAFLEELESFKLSGNKDQDIESLKEFGKKWSSLGHIPRKAMDAVNGKFNQILDGFYSEMGITAEELEHSKFMGRLESFENAENSDELIASERRFIAEKIATLTETLAKYENNLSFFGNGSGPLYKEAEKKVTQVQKQVENWKQKQKLLRVKAKELATDNS